MDSSQASAVAQQSGIPRPSRLPGPSRASRLPVRPGPPSGQTATSALRTRPSVDSSLRRQALSTPSLQSTQQTLEDKKTSASRKLDLGENDSDTRNAVASDYSANFRNSLSDRTAQSLSQVPPPTPTSRRMSSSLTKGSQARTSTSRPASSDSGSSRPGSKNGSRTTLAKTPVRPGGTMLASKPVARRGGNIQSNTPARPTAPSTPQANRRAIPSTTPSRQKTATPAKTPHTGHGTATPAIRRTDDRSQGTPTERKVSNSSAALREQIAKAKAARKSPRSRETAKSNDCEDTASYDSQADPFNQALPVGSRVLRKRIDGARSDGQLNISAMGLQEIPPEVMRMYDFDSLASGVAWSESVDLVRLVAADNELTCLPPDLFPDLDPDKSESYDDDSVNPQFGGLEVLDLHGNILRTLPTGLRWLSHLSTLNLSRNALGSGELRIISQLSSLKDLRLAGNNLSGEIPSEIGQLERLESLDVQQNKLTSLPRTIESLNRLRVLKVGSNQLSELPLTTLCDLPLVEISCSNNALSGALDMPDGFEHLHTLDLASNSITSLGEVLRLGGLQNLNISFNKIRTLPKMNSCVKLLTLLAEDNSISTLPESLLSLKSLKIADFTGNDLVTLDARLALMDSLHILRLAANPLRDRKFLSMHTEDVKRELEARLEQPSHQSTSRSQNSGVVTEDVAIEDEPEWDLRPSGLLDLSNADASAIDGQSFKSFLAQNAVRQVNLRSLGLNHIPMALGVAKLLTSVDLTGNRIEIVSTASPMELPAVKELRLASNLLRSFESLVRMVEAPRLQHLDVSFNRLNGPLPNLKDAFPDLTLLSASNNAISDVSSESLRGLQSVDLSNNDIGRLEPEIGLLADTLRNFKVDGNRFRVPNYHTLSRGTEAILAYLKDRMVE